MNYCKCIPSTVARTSHCERAIRVGGVFSDVCEFNGLCYCFFKREREGRGTEGGFIRLQFDRAKQV